MTLDYLRLTGRDPERVQLAETYAKEQACSAPTAHPTRHIQRCWISTSRSNRALPGRSGLVDRVTLEAGEIRLPDGVADNASAVEAAHGGKRRRRWCPSGAAAATGGLAQSGVAVADPALEALDHGAVVIAAITSVRTPRIQAS